MKRWFAIVCLVLLPVQFTWAAVASYCNHEVNPVSQHYGHHSHQHESNDGSNAGGKKLPSGLDNDCTDCHASCAVTISDVAPLQVVEIAAMKGPMDLGALSFDIPSKPERPKWAFSA